MISALEPRIRRITSDLLDTALPVGRIEIIEQFAIPLPVVMIAELLGVPPEDQAVFKQWSNEIVNNLGREFGSNDGRPPALQQARDEIRQSWRRTCADNAGHLHDYDRVLRAARRTSRADIDAACSAEASAGAEAGRTNVAAPAVRTDTNRNTGADDGEAGGRADAGVRTCRLSANDR